MTIFSVPQPSDVGPLKTGFTVSVHSLIILFNPERLCVTLFTLVLAIALRGVAELYVIHEDIRPPQRARSEYHTQLAKMSFDEIFDLTAGVHFYFIFKYRNKAIMQVSAMKVRREETCRISHTVWRMG